MFKVSNFKTFESIRKNKEKGGSLLLVHEDWNPILVKEYNESFELLVVEVSTEKLWLDMVPRKTGKKRK